ncbi:MAG: nuclear transport factor 2 family protein [Cyclobacteriaceae bacterium]
MRRLVIGLFLVVICIQQGLAQLSERSVIEQLVSESYVGPVYARTDISAMKRGFHENFTHYILEDGKLVTQNLEEWIKEIEEARKEKRSRSTFEWLYELIDVEDQTALVKLRIAENGQIRFVDYLTLYKFPRQGWKIITKEYSTYN